MLHTRAFYSPENQPPGSPPTEFPILPTPSPVSTETYGLPGWKVSSRAYRPLTQSFEQYLITSPSQFRTGPRGSGAYSLMGVLHVCMATV